VRSADYRSLEDSVKEFLASTRVKVDSARFAVAGPVIEGRVKTTNLPWVRNVAKDALHQGAARCSRGIESRNHVS